MLKTVEIIVEQIKEHFPSDAAFEAAAGLKPKTVDSWKRDNSKGFLKILPNLSKLFGVSTDYLLGNEQKNKPTTNSDELTNDEILFLEKINQLDEDGRKLALAQLDALLTVHQDNKDI